MGVKQQIKNHQLNVLAPSCVLFKNMCQEDMLFVNGKNYWLNSATECKLFYF